MTFTTKTKRVMVALCLLLAGIVIIPQLLEHRAQVQVQAQQTLAQSVAHANDQETRRSTAPLATPPQHDADSQVIFAVVNCAIFTGYSGERCQLVTNRWIFSTAEACQQQLDVSAPGDMQKPTTQGGRQYYKCMHKTVPVWTE